METMKFKVIITGPKEYFPERLRVEDFEITEQEVLEVIEEGETSEDVIEYLKEEYCAEWEQHWCRAVILSLEDFEKIKNVEEFMS